MERQQNMNEFAGHMTPDEERLAVLLDRLPEMEQVKDRLEADAAFRQLDDKYRRVDELEQAIDALQAYDPDSPFGDPRLREVLLKEKRAALDHERMRFEHDLERSRFGSILEANAAKLSPVDRKRLEDELNAYREEYAYSLSRCAARK